MNLRKLLPRRIVGNPLHHRAIFRAGLSYIMSGVVELSSLGKMSTKWNMVAVNLPDDQWALRRFFESVAKLRPYAVHTRLSDRSARRARIENVAQALADIATGAVETLSAGYVSADWAMMWRVYGEEILDEIEKRLRSP